MIGKKILSYEITDLLGQGGMGNVYLAVHVTSGEKVAIKSLLPQLMRHDHIRERFKMEAEAISLLPHPNIVKLIAYKEDGESAYIIMEYVEGKDLSTYIKTVSGPMPEEVSRRVMQQILNAFSFAHDHGVVHRDIKPSNILITSEGQIKIIDFGIAKVLSEADRKLTKTGLQMGAVFYMSPEQVRGKTVDRRSDIYSLGVTFFQMITGQSPYESMNTEYEIYSKIVAEPLPSVRSIYPGAFLQFDGVIAKATAKEPDQRFDDCMQFSKALSDAFNLHPGDGKEQVELQEPGIVKQHVKEVHKRKEKTNLSFFIAPAVILLALLLWQVVLHSQYRQLLSQGQNKYDTQFYENSIDIFRKASEKRKLFIWGQGEDVATPSINNCYFEMYKKEGEDSLNTNSFLQPSSNKNSHSIINAFKKAKEYKSDDEFVNKRITLCEKINEAIQYNMRQNYSSAIAAYKDAIYYAQLIGVDKKVLNQLYNAQAAVMSPKSKFMSIRMDHGVFENDVQGIRIHFKFEAYFLKYKQCKLTVWFYYDSGEPLKDKNSIDYTTDGSVAIGKPFSPDSEIMAYDDFEIFMPYKEMEIDHSGTYKFFAAVILNSKQIETASEFQRFTYSTDK